MKAQEKTWWGNLNASDLEKHMSSRSSLVHHLHFEFSEHCDFNTNSPQLGGITLLLCLLSLLVDQSSPNPQEGWHTTRTKRIRNSALDFNTIFGWCKPQKRFQLSKWLLMLNHLSFLLTTEPKLILESGPSDVGKGCWKDSICLNDWNWGGGCNVTGSGHVGLLEY